MAKEKTNSIAIAISTRGRKEILNHSLQQWQKHYPNAKLIVVEDNDTIPRGIAKTKNICRKELLSSGCDHCFIADDDVYPLDNVGVYKYIESGFRHMCMSFDHTANGRRISHDVYIHLKHPEWWSFNSPCGCLLYVNREVLESGISYDENFGIWGKEHSDYSLQIHKAGYTPLPFLDIPNSTQHFYSHDYHQTVESSVPEHIRVKEINRNIEYFNTKHS